MERIVRVRGVHRLFFGLLDMAIVNSHVIFIDNCEEDDTMCMFDYYRSIALELLTYRERTSRAPVKMRKLSYSTPDSVRFSNVGMQFPVFVPNKN